MEATSPGPGDEGAPPPQVAARRVDLLLVAFVVVASLPIVISTHWAATHDYTTTGDRSLIALNAHRVVSSEPPTVGMPSTLFVDRDDGSRVPVSHLGPAEFGALALPSVLTGGSTVGLLAGVALVNVASLAVTAWAASRLLSRLAAGWLMAACVALSWGLGATLLWDNWNPYITLLPMVALLTTAAATVGGHRTFLPIAAGFAVFVAQAHLSTVLLGVAVGAWALGAGLWFDRRVEGPGVARRWRWPLVATAVVVALTWLPPAMNQLDGPGGNISLLIESMGQGRAQAGWSYALEMGGRIGQVPPVWLFEADSVFALDEITPADALVSLAMLGLFFVVLVEVLRRGRDARGAAALVSTAAVALGLGMVSLSLAPSPPVSIAYVRWVWPLGMFVWFATGYGIAVLVGERLRDGRPELVRRAEGQPWATWLAVAPLAVGIALVPLAVSDPDSPKPDAIEDWRSITVLSDGVEERLDGRTPLLVFHGLDAGFSGGPELWRRLWVGGTDVKVPESYSGGTSKVFAIGPDDEVDLEIGIYGARAIPAIPKRIPTEVLGIGLDDPDEADAWVAEAERILASLPPGQPVVLTPEAMARLRHSDPQRAADLAEGLVDARMAMFDREVLEAIVAGEADQSPISAADAEILLDGLDEGIYFVLASAPPTD